MSLYQISCKVNYSLSCICHFLEDTKKCSTNHLGAKPKPNSMKKRLILRKEKQSEKSAGYMLDKCKANATKCPLQQILTHNGDLKCVHKIKALPLSHKHYQACVAQACEYALIGDLWDNIEFAGKKKFSLDGLNRC